MRGADLDMLKKMEKLSVSPETKRLLRRMTPDTQELGMNRKERRAYRAELQRKKRKNKK